LSATATRLRPRWQIPAGIALCAGTRAAGIAAALLALRGYSDPTERAAFLSPALATLADPTLLADLPRALARLKAAHARNEQITIWGDYDVDGLTSTALLCRAFAGMGFRATPHIPHRARDGYGMNEAGIDRVTDAGTTLIVAVDCGISSRKEIAHAATRGVDVIVLDHHTIPPELPDAVAIINPRRADCPYPFKELAAVGLAHALVRALTREGFALCGAWADDEPDLLDLLELVALGTVADVAPLRGENRVVVTWGLNSLRHTPHPGLRALYAVAGLDPQRLTAWEIGHALGPRLNAAGRLGDAGLALRLLLAESSEEALPLAQELDALNRQRQRELARIMAEAVARVEESGALADEQPIIQIDGTGWTAGVVGLVASRLAERYGRPTIVLERGEQESKGSGRSIDGFNLIEALAACGDLLKHHGGHARAAGLTVANDNLAALHERLLIRARATLTADDLRPTLTLDLDLALADIGYPLTEAFATLEPFGNGNPEPLILLRDIGVKWPKVSGDGKHLFFTAAVQGGTTVRAPLRCVAFGQGERRSELQVPGARFDLAGTLRREWWQGEERLSFHIRDFREAE
jgi:single-stranded-DNA-specific exonuclease